MTITYSLRSRKDPATIYIRLRIGGSIDIKIKTRYLISPKDFKKGKVRIYDFPKSALAHKKREINDRNKPLIKLQEELDALASRIRNGINNLKEYEVVNSNWLNNILNPTKSKTTTLLVKYFDVYFNDKETVLRKSTIKKLKTFQQRLEKYEQDNDTIYIAEVNNSFKSSLSKWLDKKGYAHNTKVKTIKVVVTICNHARYYGITTHPELEYLTKGLKYIKTPHVYLTFGDINKIENVELLDKRLDIARDWLIISCYTAQRVSDFLKFTKNNIVTLEGSFFLDINQEKTGTPVYIPLNDTVLNIIKKYKGNFPPPFTKNITSNEVIYNRLIKDVCKIAKINEIVKANLKQKKKNRYKIVEVPKWKAVSSHIGRRSFATNYIGKINTALLKDATGHASEKQLLAYVGKKPKDNALLLAKELRRLSEEQGNEPQLTVIKNAQ